ncbi:MAG: DNA/RNA non-specific endonuclease [Clostridia bacterium]|nr:DNA/RNA non-specific endonuclease [Clostridia bacterium]
MLPVRFIAESFNLAVAWESDTQTITIIRNSFDSREYDYLMSVVPAYSGSPYAIINNGIPLFKDYEIIDASFEYYSCLDELGRCDVAMASVSKETMPTDERGDISSITPTGWKNTKYDIVSGGYLYNRCHLIGYQLTGENDNAKNLITGTGYMNISGMLPLENRIDYYIEYTGNHVMYRVTPVFIGNNLLADGVLMEAYSVEDDGLGISFCVYCYNVQPFICIDYTTGDNSLDTSSPYIQGLLTQQPVIKEDVMPELPPFPDNVITQRFFRTPTGKRYHLDPDCGGKNSYETTYEEAISSGLTPCQKCAVP